MTSVLIELALITIGFVAMATGLMPIAVPRGGVFPNWGRAQNLGAVAFFVGIAVIMIGFGLLVCSTSARAQAVTPWQPPAGMVFDTRDGKCTPTRDQGPYIQGCYFGKAENPTEHVGLAFFRKCGPYRQMMPFLVADFDTNELSFYSDPSKPTARVYKVEIKDGQVDPDPWYNQLPPVIGPCWIPAGRDI